MIITTMSEQGRYAKATIYKKEKRLPGGGGGGPKVPKQKKGKSDCLHHLSKRQKERKARAGGTGALTGPQSRPSRGIRLWQRKGPGDLAFGREESGREREVIEGGN